MIYVVFVEPKTPGNIGFLARTMKNFGLSNLVLINPCQLEHEAYYQSMHAREIIYNRQEFSLCHIECNLVLRHIYPWIVCSVVSAD